MSKGQGQDVDPGSTQRDGAVDDDGMATWTVRKFDPAKQLHPDSVVLLLGRRGSGKTILLKDLMETMKDDLFAGLGMTPTQDSVEMFEEFLPRPLVFDDFDDSALERVLEAKRRLSRRNARRRKKQNAHGIKDAKKYIALILDDCMAEKKNLNKNVVRDVFMNGRHEDLFFVNLQQYVTDMSPALRTQVDFVFTFREPSLDNRMKLWRFFFGMFKDYNDFSDLMDGCTENHEVLVLANRVQSNDWRDCIFWYKARKEVPRFRLGSSKIWFLSYMYGQLACDIEREHEAHVRDTVNKTFRAESQEEETMREEREQVTDEKKMIEYEEKAKREAQRKLIEKHAKEKAKKEMGRKKVRKLGSDGRQERKLLSF